MSDVDMDGIELELRYRISDTWSCHASYTYNRSKVVSFAGRPELEGNDLPYTPNHTGTAGLVFSDPGLFNLSMKANAVGERYSDEENSSAGKLSDYVTLDLKIWRTFGKATFSLGVANVFDVEYEPRVTPWAVLVAPGRVITGSASIRF